MWRLAPTANGSPPAAPTTRLRFWDTATGQPIGQPLTGHTEVWCLSVAFSPDGHRLATASNDKTVRLWNADTGQPLGDPLTGHTAPVYSVAFSPDGERIASGSWDDTLRMWDADKREPVGQPLTGHTDFLEFVSPHGCEIPCGLGAERITHQCELVSMRWVGRFIRCPPSYFVA